ncbi:MAG: serine/threonine protein kinase, partial [Hyphomicrobiaceae bacterium]
SRIAGYEIKRVLGAGGFGITYEGFNPITRNRVAIKEFFPRGIVSRQGATIAINDQRDRDVFEKALRKFEESTSKLCGLSHPNIVKVHDYIPGNRTGYMLMEYLEGDSVRGRLDASPTKTLSSVDEMRRIYEPVLDALRYIHTNSVLHRDLSPDNVMIVKGGRPVLIDFGALRDTKTGNRVSTLLVAREAYAPFEQLSPDGPEHGSYTDIYTIAASMYECLAGEPPVRASNRLWGKADPYVSVGKTAKIPCPPTIAAAIDHALRVRIEDRPQSIDAFLAELGWGGAQPATGQPSASGQGTAVVSGEETAAWNQARQTDQLALYHDFLRRFPGSRFADAARERIGMLTDPESTELLPRLGGSHQAAQPTQLASPPTQLAHPPQQSQPFAGGDAQWFLRIRANPNLQDLNQFLWRFPNSPFAAEARGLMQSLQGRQQFPQQAPQQFGAPQTPGIPPQQFPGAGYAPPPTSSGNAGAILGVLAVVVVAAGVLAYTLWPKPAPIPNPNPNPNPTQDVRIGRLSLHIDPECTRRRSDQGSMAVFASCATNKIADDAFRRQPNSTVSQCVSLCSQDTRCNAFDFENNECLFYEEVTAVSNIVGTAGIKR